MKLSFAIRLQQIMVDRGITQADLVRMCQPLAKKRNTRISVQDVSRYVNASNFPTEDKLEVLADTLGVPAIWLMGFEPADGISKEEIALCSAWRACSNKERETIAFILKDYGFALEKKDTVLSGIA